MDQASTKKSVNPLIKVFVIGHLFLILNWSLPKPAPAISNGTIQATPANIATHFSDYLLIWNEKFKYGSPTKYYLLATGLWQYWDMFAPNPANSDIWWDSVVTFQSGRQAIVVYPRMKDLGIFEKYIKERYRKYLERVNTDASDAWKRPTFAQRMALLAYKDPKDPPVRVLLRRHFKTMESMYTPIPKDYTVVDVFDYVVNQDKLVRDAAR